MSFITAVRSSHVAAIDTTVVQPVKPACGPSDKQTFRPALRSSVDEAINAAAGAADKTTCVATDEGPIQATCRAPDIEAHEAAVVSPHTAAIR